MQGVEDLSGTLLGLIIHHPHVMVQLCELRMCISPLDQCVGATKIYPYRFVTDLHLMLLPKIHMALI